MGAPYESLQSIVIMTFAQLQTAIATSQLVEGWRIFVSDLPQTDRGAWLFCSSANTVSEDAEGLFLDVVWAGQTHGPDSDIEVVTTIAPTGYPGQWKTSVETFTIDYSNLSAPFDIGETVLDDGNVWEGIITADTGTVLTVYSTGSVQYPPGAVLTGQTTSSTADIDSVGSTSCLGKMVAWIEPGAPQKGWSMYQCTDDTKVNATGPVVNNTAYTKIARRLFRIGYSNLSGTFSVGQTVGDGVSWFGEVVYDNGIDYMYVFSTTTQRFPTGPTIDTSGFPPSADIDSIGTDGLDLGYILDSEPIKYDIANSWLLLRQFGTISYLLSNYMGLGVFTYNPIVAFPWGNPIVHDIAINEGLWDVPNPLADDIGPINIGYAAELHAVMKAGSTLTGIVLDNNSKLGVTVNAGIDLTDTRLLQGVEYQNKTIDASWSDCLIPASDNTTETVSSAPSDILGMVTKTFLITGLTTLNLGGLERLDFVMLTSTNGTEVLNAITNAPTSGTFKVIPEAGLAVTFTGTAYGGAANSIALPVASLVINGSKGENITFAFNGNQSVYQDSNQGIV